uniref:Endonuclease/exonuclease/phosphatase domain-containing protein n=1 Tax=Caenorhabditis japonica TaxID=281687 RepID=A0A8R1IIB4_CAEJA
MDHVKRSRTDLPETRSSRKRTCLLDLQRLARMSCGNEERESDRIITVTFNFLGSHLHVINVYAPTSAANETQSDKFYKDLKKVYTRLLKWDSSIIICGDFNAVVGCSSDDLPYVGGHGTGQRSDNGDRLVNFAKST